MLHSSLHDIGKHGRLRPGGAIPREGDEMGVVMDAPLPGIGRLG